MTFDENRSIVRIKTDEYAVVLYLRCIWLEAWPFVGDPKTSGKVGWASEVVVARSAARWLQPSQAVETTTLLKPTGNNKKTQRT